MARPIERIPKTQKVTQRVGGTLAKESNGEWSRTSAFLRCRQISGKEGSLALTSNTVTPNTVLPDPLGTFPISSREGAPRQ